MKPDEVDKYCGNCIHHTVYPDDEREDCYCWSDVAQSENQHEKNCLYADKVLDNTCPYWEYGDDN